MKMSEAFCLPLRNIRGEFNGIEDNGGAIHNGFESYTGDMAAAHAINCHDELVEALTELRSIVQGHLDGEDTMDSFTLQVADSALAKAKG